MALTTFQLSSTTTYRRLLDEETCILDELLVSEKKRQETTQTKTSPDTEEFQLENDTTTFVYWLCYDERDDVLSASKSRIPPSQPSSYT